jgi:predicted nucleic acid-binding protein
MTAVLDASAMTAWLRKESGWDVVPERLERDTCLVHTVNLIEVYYDALRRSDEQEALRTRVESAIADLVRCGVRERSELDPEFWRRVAEIKAANRVSLADCFALALAERTDADLLTTDHHEFDSLATTFRIRFVR